MYYQIAQVDDWKAIALLHAQSWQRNYRGSFSDHYLDHQAIAERQKIWEERFSNPKANRHVVLAKEEDLSLIHI